MPHRIVWAISYKPNLDAEHLLNIELDPNQVKQGLVTPPHNLTIRFPKGSAFTPFYTKWHNAPSDSSDLRANWGHETETTSGERYYRIGYQHLKADIPQWDWGSVLELELSTCQSGAWTRGPGTKELVLTDIKVTPPADGEKGT